MLLPRRPYGLDSSGALADNAEAVRVVDVEHAS